MDGATSSVVLDGGICVLQSGSAVGQSYPVSLNLCLRPAFLWEGLKEFRIGKPYIFPLKLSSWAMMCYSSCVVSSSGQLLNEPHLRTAQLSFFMLFLAVGTLCSCLLDVKASGGSNEGLTLCCCSLLLKASAQRWSCGCWTSLKPWQSESSIFHSFFTYPAKVDCCERLLWQCFLFQLCF